MHKFLQKGVSLYLAIIIMAIILAIVLGLNTIFLGQIKMIRGMGYSVVALYAADTGVEKMLKDVYNYFQNNIPFPSASYSEILDNNSNYTVNVFCCEVGKLNCLFVNPPPPDGKRACPAGLSSKENCGGSFFCIESVGTYQKTQRAIEVKM